MAQEIYESRWNSGETAGTMPATVFLGPGGLSIRDPQTQAQIALWNYEDLTAGAPVGKRSGDVLLRNKQTPRATLFIEGPGIGEAVIVRAPQIAQSFQRRRIVLYGLIFTVLVAAVGAVLFFSDFSASKEVARFIPEELADRMGRQGIEAFGPVAPSCVNQPGNVALQRILDRLQGSGNFGRPFKLHVTKSSTQNAFALPGRHIVLLSGLVNKAKSPEEVAGVMAHEMGHELERDPEAGLVRAIGMQTMLMLLSGGGNGTALDLGAVLLQLQYSRDAEHLADVHAVEILRKARIAPKATGDFFSRDTVAETITDRSITTYLSTHPSSKERAKLFFSQPAYATEPVLTAEEWKAAQVICGETLRTNPPSTVKVPQNGQKTPPPDKPKNTPRDRPAPQDGPKPTPQDKHGTTNI